MRTIGECRLWWALAVLMTAVAGLPVMPRSAGAASTASASTVSCPALVSHDGYSGPASIPGYGPVPLNSTAALRYAARLGSRAVKFDLRWSSDNVPVTIHNETVYASTGWMSAGVVHHHHGKVAYKTAATLESFHLLSLPGAYTSSVLPSTRAMLRAAVAAGDTSAIIEIKVPVISARQVRSLHRAVTASGATAIMSVQTFFTQNVRALQRSWPRVPGQPHLRIALLEHAPAIPPAGVKSVVLTGSAVTPHAVGRLTAAGLRVGAYTSTGAGVPDSSASWSAEKAAGIRQVFTNDPAGYLAWRGDGCP